MNPSFVDEEALQDLAIRFANNKDKDYLKKSAKDKMSALWAKIAENQSPGKWPNTAGIFLEGMEDTFKAVGDVMPVNFALQNRTKFIHAVGATGKVRFVSNGNHPYTGIFKGADQGIVRFSSAAEPGED